MLELGDIQAAGGRWVQYKLRKGDGHPDTVEAHRELLALKLQRFITDKLMAPGNPTLNNEQVEAVAALLRGDR